jgi:hypothetical protein
MTIREWLAHAGFGQYADAFEENEVTVHASHRHFTRVTVAFTLHRALTPVSISSHHEEWCCASAQHPATWSRRPRCLLSHPREHAAPSRGNQNA